jgi:Flp pilus assembly pilin Flp
VFDPLEVMERSSRSAPAREDAAVRRPALKARLRPARDDEQGQLVEYTAILVFVSIAGVAVLTAIGLRVDELLALARDAFP